MSVPIILTPGYSLIYGAASTQGISVGNKALTFGTINQTGAGQPNYSIGQSVLFPYKEATTLTYQNQAYFLIDEAKIIFSEDAIEPEPEPEP